MFTFFRRSADPIAVSEAHTPERKAARPLLATHLPRGAAMPSQSYIALCREGFARNPIAHRCVRLIAESAASVPLRSSDARAAKLLARGVPGRSAVETLESFYGYLQLGGNGFLETVLSGDAPIALITPTRHTENGPRRERAGHRLDASGRSEHAPFSARYGDGGLRLVSYALVQPAGRV